MVPPPTRRSGPKGDKRERTRAKLLAAAREVIREKGYEQTTLREVAQRAGMTSGAIYSNFKDRDDLFIALADVYWPPLAPRFDPGGTFAGMMDAIAGALIAALPDRRVAAPGRLTGMAHALKNEATRRRVRDMTRRTYDASAMWLETVADRRDLPMPADVLVRVLHAMIEGLTYQRLLTPELFPDDVVYAAFRALADQGAKRSGRPRGGRRAASR